MYRTTACRWSLGLILFVCASAPQLAFAQSTTPGAVLLEPGAAERIATGFSFPEGPVWHPDGYLLFSDIHADSINKWTPDGVVAAIHLQGGHPNGLTLDRQGELIACEQITRRVVRIAKDGTAVILAAEYDGKKLNSPNDVVVKSDGSIYFTDPPYGSMWGTRQELVFAGIYRLLPGSHRLDLLTKDIPGPNGIAFSPDEKALYVSDTDGMIVYVFDVLNDGTLANKRIFIEQRFWPDGLKVDAAGNLYVSSGMPSVMIFDSHGRHLEDIAIPEPTTNCAFGGSDYRTLFVTAGGSLYRVRIKVPGIPVFTHR